MKSDVLIEDAFNTGRDAQLSSVINSVKSMTCVENKKIVVSFLRIYINKSVRDIDKAEFIDELNAVA